MAQKPQIFENRFESGRLVLLQACCMGLILSLSQDVAANTLPRTAVAPVTTDGQMNERERRAVQRIIVQAVTRHINKVMRPYYLKKMANRFQIGISEPGFSWASGIDKLGLDAILVFHVQIRGETLHMNGFGIVRRGKLAGAQQFTCPKNQFRAAIDKAVGRLLENPLLRSNVYRSNPMQWSKQILPYKRLSLSQMDGVIKGKKRQYSGGLILTFGAAPVVMGGFALLGYKSFRKGDQYAKEESPDDGHIYFDNHAFHDGLGRFTIGTGVLVSGSIALAGIILSSRAKGALKKLEQEKKSRQVYLSLSPSFSPKGLNSIGLTVRF